MESVNQELNDRLSKLSDVQRKLLEKKIREMKEQKRLESEVIVPAQIENSSYALTDTQEAIWLIEQLYSDKGIYNSAGKAIIRGDVDVNVLIEAVEKIVDAHTILKTVFREVEGVPTAIIKEDMEFACEKEDVSGYANPKEELENVIAGYVRKTFDVENGPLLRIKFVKVAEAEWCVIVVVHHIISDGISTNVLLGEMIRYYKEFQEKKTAEVNKPQIQFSDYAVWLKKQRDKANLTKDGKKFWTESLADANYSLDVVRGKNNVEDICKEGIRRQFCIEKELFDKVSASAMTHKVTVFSVLLSALNLVLYKTSKQSDLICGVALSGRDRAQLSNLIGCFIGVIPVRSKLNDEITISDFIKDVHQNYLQAYNYRDDYFRLNQKDVCQLMFSYEEAPDVVVNYKDVKIEFEEIETGYNRNELELELNRKGDEIVGWINYRKDNFDERFVQAFIGHYKETLRFFHQHDTKTIGEVEMISQAESDMINAVNAASKENVTEELSVAALFEKSTSSNKDKIAVVANGIKKTYGELNADAKKIADYLVTRQVKANDYVLLIGKRDVKLLAGMLGINKCGAAYVPVDPDTPIQRIQSMVEQCHPKMVLTVGCAYANNDVNVVDVDEILAAEDVADSVHLSEYSKIEPETPCYVIFTSGSTGVPKGVIIPHRAVANYCFRADHNSIANLLCSRCDSIVSVTTLSFDIFVTETWLPLINGMTVIMANEEEQNDSEAFGNLVCTQGAESLQTTPSRMRLYMESPDYARYLKKLKVILLGGEMFDVHVWKRISQVTDALIVNVYGPTETTVWSSYQIMPKYSDDACITIGKPILNTQFYVMNGKTQCGVGMIGELCIAGMGVSGGYLNNQELTDEKFIDNPYGEGKLYRTGDNARWLQDGTVECLGRIDYQVKIRGYRIEAGEIENAILNTNLVKEVVVVAKKDDVGLDVLCAYFTADNNVDVAALRTSIRETLPDYMIPAFMMQLEKLPLNSNGKIDRKKLPAPEIVSTEVEYVAPVTMEEIEVAGIFAEVVGIERVGLNDNFFNIGGYSLKAVKVINAIAQKFDKKITLSDFFENPTVAGICEKLAKCQSGLTLKIPKAERMDQYPASSEQSRIYFLHKLDDVGIAYNMPMLYSVEGSFSADRARASLVALMNRHAVLRTSFAIHDGKVVQIINDNVAEDFEYVKSDARIMDVNLLMDSFIKPFDLEKAPLIRMKVVEDGENHCYVLFDLHHVIADALTVGIIAREYAQIYQGVELDEIPVSYADYSVWQQTRDYSAQAEFWKYNFNDEIPVLNLPLDYLRPRKQSFSGEHVFRHLTKEKTEMIDQYCLKHNVTPYVLFTSTLMLMLGKYSGQDDVIVGTTVSGRMSEELENVAGVFINTLPIRGRLKSDESVKDFIESVKQFCVQALDNQEYPFEQILDDVNVQRDLSRNPMFDVMLTYNGIQERQNVYDNIVFKKEEISNAIAKLDLNLEVTKNEIGYQYCMEYCTALWKTDSIERMLDRYDDLMMQIIAGDDRQIGRLEFILEDERRRLDELNATGQTIENRELTISKLFELEAEKHPDRTAVCFNGKTLSYRQLNERSNCVAHALREKGVTRGSYVAIIADRSELLFVGLLGILKAGGCYIPVDPQIPEQRIQYMLQKAKCEIAVVSDIRYGTEELDVINLTDESLYAKGITVNPENINTPEDLCYTIFTSGTTGNPKGVMLTHRSVHNYCAKSNFNIFGDVIDDECKTILSVTTISFDIFVTESWLPLTNGLTVILADENQQRNPKMLNDLLTENPADVIQTTPSRVKMMMIDEDNNGFLAKARVIMLGGEKVDASLVKNLQKITDAKIVDVYGPTETTVWSTYYVIPKNFGGDELPIGRPIANTQIYVLSSEGKVGFDVLGELCIGGDGLARGYLHEQELTDSKFVSIPGIPTKVYRTGDLAKWSSKDECLYYVNRMDNQVKIRGYRIELGEIEKTMEKLEDVEQAVVVVREVNASQHLVAFVKGRERDTDELKGKLRARLPEYMVPSKIVYVDSFQMNSNGKVDRKKLPDVEINTTREMVLPVTAKDIVLVDTIKEVLGISHEISMLDNFFEIGGDSIKAIQVVSKMNEKGMPIELAKLFGEKNIGMINSDTGVELAEQEAAESEWTGEMPVTASQDYVLRQLGNKVNRMIMPVWFETEHNKLRFDEFALRYTLDELAYHHDVLRACLKDKELEVVDSDNDRLYELKVFHIQNFMDCEGILETETQKVMSTMVLTKRPVLKSILFKMRDRDRLVTYFNRFLLDWKSVAIFIEDFINVYAQYAASLTRSSIDIPKKTVCFAEWSKAHKFNAVEDVKDSIADAARHDESIRMESVIVPANRQADVVQVTEKFGIDESIIYVAALRNTLARRSEFRTASFQTRYGDGSFVAAGEDFTRTLGNFDCLTILDGKQEADVEKLLNETKNDMNQMTESNDGSAFESLREADGSSEIDVRFEMMDESVIHHQENPIGITYVTEVPDAGTSALFAKMVFSIVKKNQVELVLTSKFGREITERVAKEFSDCVNEIIEYCISNDKRETTASTFNGENDVTAEVLDEIMDMF